MGFWSTTKAAASWISTWFPQEPGYLRSDPPALPPIPSEFTLQRLTAADAGPIAALWRTSYGGDDWAMDVVGHDLLPYLTDSRVVFLGLFREEGLVATIAAVPFGNTTRFSHGSEITESGFHVVEGLVVREDVRGQGVAGILISAIDGLVSRLYSPRPFACLWSREIATLPRFPTFISCSPYSWCVCVAAGTATHETTLNEFQTFWTSYIRSRPDSISTDTFDNRRGGLRVFRVGAADYGVVSNTRRKTKKDRTCIYEIVWASNAAVIDIVKTHLTGLLFTTYDMTGREGWTVGDSGYHAYSIYNYRPPRYGGCEVLAIREEL